MKIKEVLRQFEYIRKEIKMLESQISSIKNRKRQIVSDTVTGCTPARSDKHVIVITGPDMRPEEQLRNKYQKLAQRRRQLKLRVEKVEKFIDSVDDSKVRQIISLRFIEGLSWRAVAKNVYGYANDNAPQMALSRYLQGK